MEKLRKYGTPPYRTAVVHGGPGAQGGMADVAINLSSAAGILEPLQTEHSVNGEIEELHKLIITNAAAPVILIGHSWGAWLSLLTAAKYPESVSKLILVSSAPFEDKYGMNIQKTRLERLLPEDRVEFNSVMQKFSSGKADSDDRIAKSLSHLVLKADSYEISDPSVRGTGERIDSRIFNSVWREAAKLRSSGSLLESAARIKCPVVAIHGDYDPHPAEGVDIPLRVAVKNFRFILLEKCGHFPWREKNASEEFYRILKEELSNQVET